MSQTPTTSKAFCEDLSSLRLHAGTWTLAQDAMLAKALAGFGLRVQRRSNELEATVADFGLEIARAQARLSTAANELTVLSRTQFMEHRVDPDEEDETLADADPATAAPGATPVASPPLLSEEEQQAAIVRDAAKIVREGIAAMKAFPLPGAEDDAADVSLPAHSYDELVLPFVIGTTEFLANDKCGLFEWEERETMRTTEVTGAPGEGESEDECESSPHLPSPRAKHTPSETRRLVTRLPGQKTQARRG